MKNSRKGVQIISFRDLKPTDLEIICSFPQSAEELFFLFPRGSFPLTPLQLQESADSRSDSTIIEYDGTIAGYANFITATFGENCSIGNVIINPHLRGKGLGKALIKEMCKTAFEKYQVRYIKISCFNENTQGLLLYKKLGFQPFDIDIWEKESRQKVALLHLKLSSPLR